MHGGAGDTFQLLSYFPFFVLITCDTSCCCCLWLLFRSCRFVLSGKFRAPELIPGSDLLQLHGRGPCRAGPCRAGAQSGSTGDLCSGHCWPFHKLYRTNTKTPSVPAGFSHTFTPQCQQHSGAIKISCNQIKTFALCNSSQ